MSSMLPVFFCPDLSRPRHHLLVVEAQALALHSLRVLPLHHGPLSEYDNYIQRIVDPGVR